MTISLGVIYLDGYFQDDDMVFSSKYFLFNKIFTDIVQISMNMLFMLDIDLIFIPILFDDNGFIDKISLEETFNLHPNVDQFIFSGTTIFVNILIENYFRYYPEKILYCVNSSQSGSDFNDNIIRLLPNDYGLNNFIANLYLRKNNFDLFYFTSSEYTKNDGIIQEGQLQINTTKKVIDDFLVEQNRQITTNPILFSLQNPEDFYKTIEKAYQLGLQRGSKICSFSGNIIWLSGNDNYWDNVVDLGEFYDVPHFLLGSMYMVYKSERNNIINNFDSHGWHSPDVWLAWVYAERGGLISHKEMIAKQVSGYSALNNNIK